MDFKISFGCIPVLAQCIKLKWSIVIFNCLQNELCSSNACTLCYILRAPEKLFRSQLAFVLSKILNDVFSGIGAALKIVKVENHL